MRTTISVDETILNAAKARAHEAGLTLGGYIEEALRRELSSPRSERGPVQLTVSSATGGPRPGVDLTTNRGLYEAVGTHVG